MRSEGLRLDLPIFPSKGCALMNSKNSKLSCFPLISSRDYHCQVISRSNSIALSTFHDCTLMHKVQPLEGSSAGRNACHHEILSPAEFLFSCLSKRFDLLIISRSVTPRFPKYGILVRDNGQQILMKSEISSMSTLDCQ